MKEDGSFSHPKDVTGAIAKLCRSIQLAMLYEMHLMVDAAGVENQLEGMDKLATFVHEKQPTPFNSLMSLQHYASSVAYSTMSMPQIWWLDRKSWKEMLFEGQHITQEHVRQVFKRLEEQVINVWENKILFGRKMHVKLGSHISDNLLRTEPGYSFLDDCNNPFNAHMKELGKYALEHHLTTNIPGTNTMVLDIMACKQWLLDLAELEGLLMVSVEMKGGAPARGTELTSMLVRNTAQRVRNAMALGKALCIVRQYDKTTNLAQGDKLIPHSIDGVDADILIQLHTFARPLAQFLAHRVFPDQPDAVNKYGEMLFMNYGMEFKSEQLSKGMANVTRPIVGWSVTVSSWRHINIAWKRKLCKGMCEVVEQTVGSTIHALQSGHSVASENRLYGLSPDALLGASEDVLQLFLNASTEWQVVNKVVPGGHGLPYHECTMDHFDHLCNEGIIKDKSQGISSKGVDDLFVAMTHVQETVLKAVKDLSVKVQQLQDELKGIQTKKDLPIWASDVFIPSGFPLFLHVGTPPRGKMDRKGAEGSSQGTFGTEKDVIVALRTGGARQP
ncbi:hypothetical protein APHAL10511_002790 [Amanita phalloides]|nr:hypothetical protein APHAL10511_002790 [Amanita phalloides]